MTTLLFVVAGRDGEQQERWVGGLRSIEYQPARRSAAPWGKARP
ncbi:hypothetical protein ACFYOT_00330 [Saccharothrix saharensis]